MAQCNNRFLDYPTQITSPFKSDFEKIRSQFSMILESTFNLKNIFKKT